MLQETVNKPVDGAVLLFTFAVYYAKLTLSRSSAETAPRAATRRTQPSIVRPRALAIQLTPILWHSRLRASGASGGIAAASVGQLAEWSVLCRLQRSLQQSRECLECSRSESHLCAASAIACCVTAAALEALPLQASAWL